MAIANGTSAGYAPGTIAVCVTWMKRGFNACQTHRSMYPSIFNRLRAIARDIGRKLKLFPIPLHLTPLLECSTVPIGIPGRGVQSMLSMIKMRHG